MAVRFVASAALTVLCGTIGLSQSPQPPQPSPTFRSGAEIVEVDVRVTDREGRFVRDLTAADFQILDNGQPQHITTFSIVEVPGGGAAPARAAVAPSATTRVFLLVLDDLQTTARWSDRVKTLARQFVQKFLMPNDQAAVITVGGGASSPLTGDSRVLLERIDRFTGRKLPSAALERAERSGRAAELNTWTSSDDPYETERAHNARTALATIRAAARSVADLPSRRKTLLFFSEGIDLDLAQVIGDAQKGLSPAQQVGEELRSVIADANRANVSVYAIDPRGLAQLADEAITAPGAGRGLDRELRNAHESLRALAQDTGGSAAVNTNDPAAFFRRVMDDASAYYIVGFSPPAAGDSTFHKLSVTVSRPGLTVRARAGYTRPRAAAAAVQTRAPDAAAAAPEAAAATTAPAAGTAAVAAAPDSNAAPDPEPAGSRSLDLVLARAAAYLKVYRQQLQGVVAEEHYKQAVRLLPGYRRPLPGATHRELLSDVLLVKLASSETWIQFRDVYSVDGKPVRDRNDRLVKLFLQPSGSALDQARAIQAESSRYNVGQMLRTINVPVMALIFLEEANQPRFRFRRVNAGNVRALASLAREADIWAIEYRETRDKTFIRGAYGRDIPASGRIWLDSATGRVLKTQLIAEEPTLRGEIEVDYSVDPSLGMLLPSEMREHNLLREEGMRIEGVAAYSRYRQFKVIVEEKHQDEFKVHSSKSRLETHAAPAAVQRRQNGRFITSCAPRIVKSARIAISSAFVVQ